MARFTDLANELILEILKHVSPSDVDAFCQLSKPIRMLTASFLQEHRKLERKYWVIKTPGGSTRRPAVWGPANLLRAIFHEPRVAAYVKIFHYNGPAFSSFTEEEEEEEKRLLRKAIQDSGVLCGAEKRAWLKEYLDEGFMGSWEDQCVALLLSLLPSLEELGLWGYDISPISKMMTRISERTQPAGLKQLKTVYIYGEGEWENGGVDDEFNALLRSFMTLPALEQLSISNLAPETRAFDPNEAPLLLPRDRKSSVVQIWLSECSLVCPILLTAPIRLDCLISFTCYWGYDSPENPTPKWVCTALVNQAGSTLKYLKLICPTAPVKLIGGLQEFVVLEQVVIDRELLVDENCPSWTQKLPRTILSLDLYDDGYAPNKYDFPDPQKLTNDTVRLMEELLSHRSNEVPKLVKVQYMPDEDMVAKMSDGIVKLMKYYLEREFCSAGIQFILLEGQPGYSAEDAEAEEASGWDTKFN